MHGCRHLRIVPGVLPAVLLAACAPSPAPAPPAPVVAAAPAGHGGSLEPSTLIAMDVTEGGLAADGTGLTRGGAFGVGIRPGVAASGISP